MYRREIASHRKHDQHGRVELLEAQHGRVEIVYCRRCRFVLRATWLAQEVLFTLGDHLGEVALIPGEDGIFRVTFDGATVFDRKIEGRFPEPKEIKQAVRDRIAPEMDLGHSDKRGYDD